MIDVCPARVPRMGAVRDTLDFCNNRASREMPERYPLRIENAAAGLS